MKRIRCFWAEPVQLAEESLRRYVSSVDPNRKCAGPSGYHAASALLGDVPYAEPYYGRSDDNFPHDDLRWPSKCAACEYVFRSSDNWQHVLERYLEGDGRRFTVRDAPAGAMWDGVWWPGKGPDGKVLIVKLPDGVEWMVDGPASNTGTPWTRTGTPPDVTASPSIKTSGYHGFLRNGWLEEC